MPAMAESYWRFDILKQKNGFCGNVYDDSLQNLFFISYFTGKTREAVRREDKETQGRGLAAAAAVLGLAAVLVAAGLVFWQETRSGGRE